MADSTSPMHLGQKNTSCIPEEPFVKLGKGNAAELNYNVPQSTCFSAKGYIPIAIEEDWFSSRVNKVPEGNYWQTLEEAAKGSDAGGNIVRQELSQVAGSTYLGTADTQPSPSDDASTVSNAETNTTKTGGTSSNKGTASDPSETKTSSDPAGTSTVKTDYSDDQVNQLIDQGLRPIVKYNLYGNPEVQFLKEPLEPTPRLVMVMHYRVCSFLGDYGAGKTLKTFSLLPGEETNISIKTWKQMESIRSKAENILDSFSESSSKELERLVEEENITSSEYNQIDEDSTTIQKGWQVGGGVDVSGTIGGKESAGISAGAKVNASTGKNKTDVESTTINQTNSEMAKVLNSAMDRQVQQSSASREVQVNTESKDTYSEGSEQATTRKLTNRNWSRTLNFVFRQLLQEYLTVIYLEDISFVFSNGYPESKRVVKLDNLEFLLNNILKNEAQVDTVRDAIMAQLCSLYDYTGTKVSFVEEVTHTIDGCCGDQDPFDETYCRIRKDIVQTVDGISVPGIIMNVKKRIIPTDSVVVDSLLGQGEALDCYNQKLQEEATRKVELENRLLEIEAKRMEQAMKIIDLIADPEKKAELYKDVFGDCCPTPQTQIIS